MFVVLIPKHHFKMKSKDNQEIIVLPDTGAKQTYLIIQECDNFGNPAMEEYQTIFFKVTRQKPFTEITLTLENAIELINDLIASIVFIDVQNETNYQAQINRTVYTKQVQNLLNNSFDSLKKLNIIP